MKLNIKIEDSTVSDELYLNLFSAGRVVGRREAKRANVSLLDNGKIVTTFDNELPSPWGLLVGSARFSVTQGRYLESVNDHLEEGEANKVRACLCNGIKAGMKDYEAATKTNEELENLDALAITRLEGVYGTLAYFRNEEEATKWATANAAEHHPWSVTYVSVGFDDELVRAIAKAFESEGGLEVSGLWRAFVSKAKAEA